MPSILNIHEFKITCNQVAHMQSFFQTLASVKFWRVKLWLNKDGFAKFVKVLCHHRFPLYGNHLCEKKLNAIWPEIFEIWISKEQEQLLKNCAV